MALDFTIKNNEGTSDKLSTQDIVAQLQGQGESVVGVSSDGTTIRLQDASGEFNVPTEKVLGQLGWQVQGIQPQNADYGNINKGWRAAITALPDDAMREAYLIGQFKRAGIEAPNIKGSGRDWYVFDPEANQYRGLTNNPEWDKSDLAEAAVKIPRFLGATAGAVGAGALAAPTGFGAIVAAGLGAGAGGGLADAATRTAMGRYDPELGNVMKKNIGDVGWDIAGESALDAGTMGLAKGLPGLFNRGIASSAAQGLGRTAEAGGEILGKTAGFLANPRAGLAKEAGAQEFSRNVLSTTLPIADPLTAGGLIAQLPGQAVRGAARGIGALGETQFMKAAAPETAINMRTLSNFLTRPDAPAQGLKGKIRELLSEQGAQKFADTVRGTATEAGEAGEDTILRNLGEFFGAKDYRKAIYKNYFDTRKFGIPSQEALNIAKAGAAESEMPSLVKGMEYGQIGKKIGRGIKNVRNFGRSAEKAGNAMVGGVLRTAQGAGKAAQGLGVGLKNAGTALSPLENRAALRYGSEEYYPRDSTWLRKKKKDTIGSYLTDI